MYSGPIAVSAAYTNGLEYLISIENLLGLSQYLLCSRGCATSSGSRLLLLLSRYQEDLSSIEHVPWVPRAFNSAHDGGPLADAGQIA